MTQNEIDYLSFTTTVDEFERLSDHRVNKDYCAVYDFPVGKIFIVSRGIGTDGAEVISHHAVVSIKKHFNKFEKSFNDENRIKTEIRNAFRIATSEVLSYITSHKWLSIGGASVAMVLYTDKRVYIANAGDCKIFMVRSKKISLLTKENYPHKNLKILSSLANSDEKTDDKDLSLSSIYIENNDKSINVIENTIGLTNIEPDISGPIDTFKNDIFFIVSKGVYQRLTRLEMLNSVLCSHKSPEKIYNDNFLKKGILHRVSSCNTLDCVIKNMWPIASKRKAYEDFTMLLIKINSCIEPPVDIDILKKERIKFIMFFILFLFSFSLFIHTISPVFSNFIKY